jgi:hypothetical protein
VTQKQRPYSWKHQFKGTQNIFENNFEGAGIQVFKKTHFSKPMCVTFVLFKNFWIIFRKHFLWMEENYRQQTSNCRTL